MGITQLQLTALTLYWQATPPGGKHTKQCDVFTKSTKAKKS